MASKHQQICGRSFDPAFEMHLTYICSGRHFCILRADAKAMYGGQLNTLYFLVGLIVSFSESKCASERHVLQVLFQHVILLASVAFSCTPGNVSHTVYIYIHPFSKTLQLEKYIYRYTSFVFTTRKQKNKFENKRYIYMYIYFSSCNVFGNGCIYIYIYIYIFIIHKEFEPL